MKNLRNLLNIKLLAQPSDSVLRPDMHLQEAKLLAHFFSVFEHSISVLSDLKQNRSYIYYGALAAQLGLENEKAEINSIWEEFLFSRIHPDDLQKKFKLELQYYQYLNEVQDAERSNIQAISKIRLRNKAGKYLYVEHRLIYISAYKDGKPWLALCLYRRMPDHPGFDVPEGAVINSKTGNVIFSEQDTLTDVLSTREKQVLKLIKQGNKTKDISSALSLSINTINRHRQNIFKKLDASNALDACRIAESAGFI